MQLTIATMRRVAASRAARIVGVFLAVRVLVALTVLVTVGPGAHLLFGTPFDYSDSRWFTTAALHGYPHAPAEGFWRQCTIAFFPGYPATITALHTIGIPAVVAGIAVNVAAGAAAAVLVAALTDSLARHTGRQSGTAGLVAACLFSAFPGGVVFAWAYSEGLAAVCAAGCLLALTRRQWWAAGLLAAAASAVRADMLALTIACLVAAVVALVRHRDWRALAAPVLAPLGAVGYFVFLWAHTGSFTVWFTVEHNGWGQLTDPAAPLLTFDTALQQVLGGDLNGLPMLLGCLAVPVIGLLLWRARMPASLVAYTVTLLVIACSSTVVGPRPRALLLALPMFCAAAQLLGRRTAVVACVLSAAGSVALMAMYMLGGSPVPP